MTTYGWPFLVSRARRATHRVVVAPDFLLAAGAESVLERVAVGDDTPAGEAVLHRSADGGLVVVSRVFVGGHGDYGIDGDGPLRDGGGRVIRCTEGLVLPGDGQPDITEADLARAHEVVSPAYRRFWAEEELFDGAPSVGVPLGDPRGAPVRLTPARAALDQRPAAPPTGGPPTAGPAVPAARNRRWRTLSLAGLVVVVAIAVGLIIRPGGGSGPAEPAAAVPSTTTTGTPAPCAGLSCLVAPPDLRTGVLSVGTPPNPPTATMVSPAQCGAPNAGLLLRWPRGAAGGWELDWSAAPKQAVDLSRYPDVVVAIGNRTGIDALRLVVVDDAGREGFQPVPITPGERGFELIPVSLKGFGALDLTRVRAVGLRWVSARPSPAQLCLAGLAFG